MRNSAAGCLIVLIELVEELSMNLGPSATPKIPRDFFHSKKGEARPI
jgi:hypothetical protein